MSLDRVTEQYAPKENAFYQNYYLMVWMAFCLLVVLLLSVMGVLLYQTTHKPLPVFYAKQANGETMPLLPFQAPNQLSDTILRFASKAATIAYTFDFVNYQEQISLARPYFTSAGWNDFESSISGLVSTIVKNQLFVSGVVVGTPVISNQGPLPGTDYAWRVQIPFLVTYQSANVTTRRNYMVIVSIIRVPTIENPQGIGIDQFVTVQS
ncbi:MAG TPA: DotI/IcmL/TraM family protein [Gammaproteobacteria bacterium]|jgi:intracellular multiplication protein IcmL|nr:DotI/IcmL/TraM family protein [Gammaproteobacteria bacterium]